MYKRQDVIRALKKQVKADAAVLSDWAERFANNPASAFSRAGETLRAATRKSVYDELISILEDPKSTATLETIAEYLLREILNNAEFSSPSTSPFSNLTAEALNQARARASRIITRSL